MCLAACFLPVALRLVNNRDERIERFNAIESRERRNRRSAKSERDCDVASSPYDSSPGASKKISGEEEEVVRVGDHYKAARVYKPTLIQQLDGHESQYRRHRG